MEKCFVLKDLILRLANEGKILLDLDETTEVNHATFAVRSPISIKSPTPMEVGPLAINIKGILQAYPIWNT